MTVWPDLPVRALWAPADGLRFLELGRALRFLGVADIAYNRPRTLPYPTENPFC